MIASDKEKHYLSLIAIKDNGGLLFPSEDIVRIVVSEKYFKAVVTGIEGHEINASKNLRSIDVVFLWWWLWMGHD